MAKQLEFYIVKINNQNVNDLSYEQMVQLFLGVSQQYTHGHGGDDCVNGGADKGDDDVNVHESIRNDDILFAEHKAQKNGGDTDNGDVGNFNDDDDNALVVAEIRPQLLKKSSEKCLNQLPQEQQHQKSHPRKKSQTQLLSIKLNVLPSVDKTLKLPIITMTLKSSETTATATVTPKKKLKFATKAVQTDISTILQQHRPQLSHVQQQQQQLNLRQQLTMTTTTSTTTTTTTSVTKPPKLVESVIVDAAVERQLFEQCLTPEIDIEEITLRKSSSNERLGLTVCYNGDLNTYNNLIANDDVGGGSGGIDIGSGNGCFNDGNVTGACGGSGAANGKSEGCVGSNSGSSSAVDIVNNGGASSSLNTNNNDSISTVDDVCTEVYISSIQPDSIAARDGRLRQGDQILQINGKDVKNKRETENLIAENCNAVTFLVSRYLYADEEEDDDEVDFNGPSIADLGVGDVDVDDDDDDDDDVVDVNDVIGEISNEVDDVDVDDDDDDDDDDYDLYAENMPYNNCYPTTPNDLDKAILHAAFVQQQQKQWAQQQQQDHCQQKIATTPMTTTTATTTTTMSSLTAKTSTLMMVTPSAKSNQQLKRETSARTRAKHKSRHSECNQAASAVVTTTRPEPTVCTTYTEYETEHIYETIPEDSESEPFYCSPYESLVYLAHANNHNCQNNCNNNNSTTTTITTSSATTSAVEQQKQRVAQWLGWKTHDYPIAMVKYGNGSEILGNNGTVGGSATCGIENNANPGKRSLNCYFHNHQCLQNGGSSVSAIGGSAGGGFGIWSPNTTMLVDNGSNSGSSGRCAVTCNVQPYAANNDDLENSSSAYNTGGSNNSGTTFLLQHQQQQQNEQQQHRLQVGKEKITSPKNTAYNLQQTPTAAPIVATTITLPTATTLLTNPNVTIGNAITTAMAITSVNVDEQQQQSKLFSPKVLHNANENFLSMQHQQQQQQNVITFTAPNLSQYHFVSSQEAAAANTATMKLLLNNCGNNSVKTRDKCGSNINTLAAATTAAAVTATSTLNDGFTTLTTLATTPLTVTPSAAATNKTAQATAMVWKVKRRPDGSRYIVRRPANRNRLLQQQQQQQQDFLQTQQLQQEQRTFRQQQRQELSSALAAAAAAITTTEEETISEVKIGRYWTKEERKKHIERARERRQQHLLQLQLQQQLQQQQQKQLNGLQQQQHQSSEANQNGALLALQQRMQQLQLRQQVAAYRRRSEVGIATLTGNNSKATTQHQQQFLYQQQLQQHQQHHQQQQYQQQQHYQLQFKSSHMDIATNAATETTASAVATAIAATITATTTKMPVTTMSICDTANVNSNATATTAIITATTTAVTAAAIVATAVTTTPTGFSNGKHEIDT